MKYKIGIKIFFLIIFIISFQFINAAEGVTTANELETMLGRDDIAEIILENNITLTNNINVTPRNVKISGNGYEITRAGYYLNATGTSGSYDITFDGISSSGSSYLFYNSTASNWNVKVTGANNITSTGGTIFRESTSSSTFTVDTGSVANLAGGGAANGIVSNYKTNIIKGEANISTTASGRTIYTTGTNALLEVDSNGKLKTDSSAGNTYETVGMTNGGTVNILGQWTASVFGAKVFDTGKETTFNVDGGTVKYTTGAGNSSASVTGSAYEQGAGATGTINVKNNGIFEIEGKSQYALESSANSSYDFNINVESGSTLNATGYASGLRVVTITGANIKFNVNGTSNIESSTGPAIQGGNKTSIQVNGGNLTANSGADNAFYTNGYGTDIKAANGGTINFSSGGTSATSRVIYISDAISTNVSNFEVLSGSKFNVKHNGAGNGIYMDDTSDTTITVDGSGSEFNVEAPNGSYALYTQKYGTDFYVKNGGKAEFISGGTGSNTFYLSDAGSPSNINVLGGSVFSVINRGTGASRGIYTDEGTTIINLDNSELKVDVSNATGTGYGIYIYNPTTTIKADNKSKINITTGGSGSVAAIRTSATGTTTFDVLGASEIKAVNNSAGGAVLELTSKGSFNVTGSGSKADIAVTNSSNSSSAVLGSASGFTINLTDLAEMYISNRSSSNATLNAGGGVIFNNPSAYDVKNLGNGPAVYNTTSSTALSLVNTDITMWDKSNSPGFTSNTILDAWSDLNANLQRTGATTVTAGSRGTTSVTMSNIGRVTAFETSAKKSTISGGTSTVINSESGTYYPGSTIIYEVTYKNDSNYTVAQAVVAKDKLSEITTVLSDGTTGQAFKSWTITASNALGSSGTSSGTTLGTYSDNTDLDTVIDIAVGDSVTYKITATVADTAVGNIVNTALIGTADVEPSITYTPQKSALTTAKIDDLTGTNTGTYYANGLITYKLTVSNASNTGFADDVAVADQLSAIKTQLNDSTNGAAFVNWTIKKPVLNGIGTQSAITSDLTDITADLADTADIAPGGSIEYIIIARVNPKAVGEITNIPLINSVSVPEATTKHTYTKLDVSKTYKGSAEGYTPGEETVYEIVIANNGSGTAGGVSVEDALSAEKTYKLDGVTEIPAYISWVITSTAAGTVSGNSNGITTDLNDTLTLGPGSSVTYTVKAKVNTDAAGIISNTVKVGGEEVKAADISPVNDKSKVSVTKKLETTLTNGEYKPGQIVEYKIEIENTGVSPVKGFNIQDIINEQKTKDILGAEINAFDSWIVTGTVDNGDAVNVTLTSETGDLNDTIDLGVGAKIHYWIEAKINANAADSIINTVKANGQDIKSPVINPEKGLSNISAQKTYTGPSQGYTPGQQISYELKLGNIGTTPALGVTAIDVLSAETTTDINGATIPAYTDWTIVSTTLGTVTGNSTGITTDLNDTLNIGAGSLVVYTITATVNPDAVGKIGNTAKVNGNDVTDPSGPKDPEDGKANVTATKTYTGPSEGYTPGQQVTYELKLTNTGTALATGVTAVDMLSSETTTDINGATVPAYTSWTITSVKTGTVSGNSTGITTDLNDTLILGGNATVTYTITATVNTDAVGKIGNTAKVNGTDITDPSGPKDPEDGKANVTSTKTYTGPSEGYTPGQQVTYELKLTNTGTALATGVTAIDTLSSETTTDINGTTVPAYTSWTITSTKTGTVSGNSNGITTDLNDTLILSGNATVTYTITATVNANAAGKIGNTAKVNGTDITDPSGPKDPEDGKANVTSTKTYTGPSQGYTPGQQVTYELKLSNTGTALATGVTAIDTLSSETTTDINGATVPAYTSWTITSVKTGTISGNSNGITTDLNDTLSMSGGSTVTYTITATVNTDAAGKIGNTAKVNGTDITDPSGPKDPEDGKANITATKTYTGPSQGYTPGQQVTYELKLTNTGTALATGITAIDTLSSETTTDINGATVPAYTSWTITSVKTGNVSGNSNGITTDLNDTLILGGNSTVTYTITATVNTDAAGKIGNTAKVNGTDITDPSGPKDPEDGKANVTATKTYTGPSQGYTPGQQVTYELKLTNTGTALATGVTAIDMLSSETTTDINGATVPAYTSWTITSVKTGTVSGNSNGITTDLNDTLSMSGGSTVTYTITATVNADAAGKIGNTAKVNGTDITDPSGPKDPEDGKANVTATKTYTGPSQGYTPGQQVTYELKLTNTGTALATGITAIDTLSSETTTDINGATVPAYISWTITSVKTGTVSGNSNGITTDLNDTLSMSGGSTVTYTITATVNADAAGKIGNTAKVNGTDITDPSGPKDPEDGKANVTSTKTYTGPSQGYTPGQQVTYELKLTNTGTALATGITAIDTLSSETTTDINGSTVPAYTSWTITSVKTGTVSGNSNGITTDLNDTLILGGNATVTYTITATVNADATGKIGNTAKVNGTDITDPSGPKDPEDGKANITATKTYTGPSQGYTPGQQVTYELKLTNTGTALATGVTAIDTLSSETTTDINGSTVPAYTSWTITSVKTGTVSGNSNGITTDLNDTLSMSGGSTVTYTITATVNADAAGKIGNTAKVNGTDITDPSGPKDPEDGKANITATKTYTGPSQGYTPGQQVTYELKLTNTGTALATGVSAVDTLSSEITTDINGSTVPAYTSWTITSTKTGTVSGNSNGITTDLNDTLSMSGGSTVTYTITATVNTDAAGKIGNTAKVNGTDITDPSGPKDPEDGKANVTATKTYTGPSQGYTPGQQVTYELKLTNTGTALATGVTAIDMLSLETTTDINGATVPAYTSWTITSVKTGTVSGNSNGITTDLNDTLSMSGGSTVTYTITATVNADAAGKIGNTAKVNGTDITDPSGPKDPEDGKGNVTSTKTYTGPSEGYTPGQQVTYELKLTNTGTALATGVSAVDTLSSEITTDINGATVPAYTSWTITSVKTGTVSGNSNGITTDLNDTLSMSGGSTVTYTITATVNTDAAGKIGNTAKVNGTDITDPSGPKEPEDGKTNVTSTKTYTGPSEGYTPGQQVTYELKLTNTGTALATGVTAIDTLSSETTTDINGSSVPAYTSWTITSTKTGTVSGNSNGITTDLNDTLSMSGGSTVTYTITATVNTNAAGKIGNTAKVNGTDITDPSGPKDPEDGKANVTATKTYTGPSQGYTPGQQVTYELKLTNTGTALATGVTAVDMLSSETTTDINGSTVPAYTSWTITSVKTGTVSGNSNGITTDLNDTLSMSGGSTVTYTITATVNPDAAGKIGNTAKVNGTDITDPSGPKEPEDGKTNVTSTKTYTGPSEGYTPGQQVTYELKLTNTGTALATGVTAIDTLSSETTTDINGSSVPAYTSWTITSTKTGTVSGNSNGITTDLNDTLSMSGGSTVTYTITATVNTNAAGKIGNTAKVNGTDITDPSGPKDPEDGKANVTATKTYTGPSQGYTPGQQVTYELKLTNTGTALATGVTAVDMLSSETTTDINGSTVPAYTSWTITSVKTGTVSGNSNGITTDLNDTLSMSGGSTVTYTITATVNPDAAGKIGNTAKVNGTDITDPSGPKDPEDGKANVTATKTYTGPTQGYTPGQQVTYELKLSNTGTALATGITAIDTLSSETTTDINGATVPAYTSWTITSVKTGTVSGNSNGITTDLNDTLSMSGGSTVTYTITATVNTNAAGKIGNTAKVNGTDITDPSGPKDPEDGKANVTSTKIYTGPSQGYTPGQQVTYELKLTNTGTALATGITAVDMLSSETTTDINGSTVPAYTSWTITSTKTGTVSGNSNGITTDLNDTLSMSGGSTVTYTITATVNADAAGKIGNTAKVNGTDITDPSGPKDPEDGKANVTSTKTYTGPSQGYTPGQQVTYELKLSNTGTALATGVTAIDTLSSETTTDINGSTVPAYTSWTITSVKTGTVSGNSNGITTDLNDTLSMSGGSTVTYTITATVNINAAGKIGNTAKINGSDVTDPSGPKDPEDGKANITATKTYTGPSQGYTPGQQVTYELKLTNTGTALATGVTAVDTLSSETTTDINGSTVPAYTSWTITSVKTGTVSGNSNGITTDLNDTLSMSGGSTVTYTITATVNADAAGKIGNTAKVNGTDITDPSGPKDPEDGKANVTATKTYTGPSQGYTPGQQVTYELKLTNTGTALATGVTAIDTLSSETTTDINGSTVPAYTSWTITSTKTGTVSGNSNGITTDLNDTLSMSGGSTVTYTITATVNTNAAGKIGNTAKVNGTDITDPSGPKDPEDGKANVTATKTYTGPTQGYTPGQQVTYELKLSNTGTALATGITAIDTLSSETTTDINGATVPAYTSWTITSTKTGTVSGNSNGITTDLNDTLSMSGGSTVTYTITATVNADAVGKIGNTAKVNGSDVTDPSGPKDPEDGKGNVTSTKTYTGPSQGYTPGQQVTYELKLSNTGTALATGVTAIDTLSSETTTDINGSTVPAYTNWTITSVKTGTVSGNSNGITTDLNDTLSMSGGSTVTYTITAIVNADAAGKIGNTAKVNGTDITDPSGPKDPEDGKGNVTATKTYTGPSQGYTPGQQVTYELKLTNTGTALATGVTAVDMLSSETTTDINGSTIPAYTSWTITATKTGTVSGNSNGITTDLNDTLSMSGGSTVTYTITATVNTKAAGKIGNTAKVNGTDITDPSGPKDPENTINNIKIKKELITDLSNGYVPGQTVQYKITVENQGTTLALGYNVQDIRTAQTTTDMSGTIIETFISWQITGTIAAGTASGVTANTTGNLNDTISLSSGGKVEYLITAVVNLNAAGKITNKGAGNGSSVEPVTPPVDPENNKGKITAKKELVTDLSNGYVPGQTVQYKITLENTGTVLVSSYDIKDVRTEQKTTDINGNSIDSYTSWSITGNVTSGTGTGVTANTTGDLNDIISLSPGGKIEYVITAVVNPNAAGKITNSGLADINKIEPPTPPAEPANDKDKITVKKELITNLSSGYTPGETVEYKITLENTGSSPVNGYNIRDIRADQKTTDLNGNVIDSFTSWTITGQIINGTIIGLTAHSTGDLNDTLLLSPGAKAEYNIKAVINPNAAGKITNKAVGNENTSEPSTPPVDPKTDNSNVTAVKELITKFDDGYTSGDSVEYKITVENKGNTIAKGNIIKDKKLEQKTTDFDGNTIVAFENWTIKGKVINGQASGVTEITNSDLSDTVNLGPNAKVEYIVSAAIHKDAYNEIINTGYLNDKELKAASIKAKAEAADLTISITASKDIVELGETVEYTVRVYNKGRVGRTGLNVKNMLPVGFSYIDETVAYKKDSSKSRTASSADNRLLASNTGDVVFSTFDLNPKEEIIITYAAKIGTTIQPGKYKTSAIAREGSQEVTATASATVQVTGNSIANSASIIGKVFEDVNGDGIQNDAGADNVVIKDAVNGADYISGTAELIMLDSSGKEISRKKISDNDLIFNGVKIDKIEGKSLNKSLKGVNKVVIRTEIKTPDIQETFMTVTTKQGMDLTYNKGKISTLGSRGDVKSGISSQEFYISKEVKRSGAKYVQELTIENVGIQEEGIAGAKLRTPSGITVTTDEYGRYHVPDEYVEKERGKNFIIKVDEASLPKGMKVITENPRVKLITQYGLNEFNFGVQSEKRGEE
jgi:uncharacterized repeat protein (TIGR01451 family)/fimbrial isopeptide formation D2 family protein